MYHLYHIKGKKWGCAKDLEKRLNDQGYCIQQLDRVIIVGNIEMADKMEMDLNISHGYTWKKTEHYINVTNMSKKSAELPRTEKQLAARSATGKQTGPINIQKALAVRGSYVGESNPRATITEELVKQIRAEYDSAPRIYGAIMDLARKYNMHKATVRNICYRDTWKHLS